MDETQWMIVSSIVLCVLLSMAMVYFVRPFGGYFVRSVPAAMVEVARAMLLPAFLGVAAFVLSVVIDSDSVLSSALAIVGVLVLIAIVRSCSIYGRVWRDNVSRRQMAQIAFGFCASVLTLTAIVSLLNAVNIPALSAASGFWIFALPVILGLAAFFAQSDRSASLARSKETIARRIVVISCIAVFAVLLVVPAFQSLSQPAIGPTDVDVELNVDAIKELQVGTPANVRIRTKEPGELSIVSRGSGCSARLLGQLQEPLARDLSPISIHQAVVPGTYTLTVESVRGRACGPLLSTDQATDALGRLVIGAVTKQRGAVVIIKLAAANKK
jgi:hypothetical protein